MVNAPLQESAPIFISAKYLNDRERKFWVYGDSKIFVAVFDKITAE